jgi:hypothetical protein
MGRFLSHLKHSQSVLESIPARVLNSTKCSSIASIVICIKILNMHTKLFMFSLIILFSPTNYMEICINYARSKFAHQPALPSGRRKIRAIALAVLLRQTLPF